MILIYSNRFRKSASKLRLKIKKALKARLFLLAEDPFNPLLNNHALQGSMRNYRSINITGDYRVVYEWKEEDVARLIDIGTHSELYGK